MSTEFAESVARLLGEELRGDCWVRFAARSANGAPGETLASHALTLYEQMGPAFAADPGRPAEPMAFAVAALAEIGDGYAMLTRLWPPEARATLPMPRRAAVEWFIREHGVDEWASGLGQILDIREARDEFEAFPEGSRATNINPSDHAEMIASDLVRIAASYETFLAVHAMRKGKALPSAAKLRDVVCDQLASCRPWAAWVHHNMGSPSIPVANAMLLMARGCFVIAWEGPEGSLAVPSAEYVRGMLQEDGAREWVAEHVLNLPKWLSS